MTPDSVMNLGEQALQVTVLLSAPILLSALAIGFIVAMFQAATQINEQTLSFVPKLLIIVVVLSIAGPWMLRLIINFTRQTYLSIPDLIG
ncbi:MAG: flagellar biosynthetic protein FliQ [Cycloclasticus pugetii]|jgi:flagellar biosynthetic protein FliQ|uniref:Flagellar biosynthetic protein FliQ n=1 Tax=Cycloclasticus zancles 78-ME TaxID=1198232 RepID=S5TVV1_9GAMM|nr:MULTISPECIES: flagellar biosynthesis protein FliQ [Cycloclasticus]AGS39255.1 Flagellar biosynthesis protein FliQ [Cycloclasticus zancles 78-ME]MBV1898907.1 flagellar biosynthesis protein FliQ [Cycloclasticus sp.]MDF1828476.1 flagellar biosynthesis protein FliQ [Cycloclasticus pugetii]